MLQEGSKGILGWNLQAVTVSQISVLEGRLGIPTLSVQIEGGSAIKFNDSLLFFCKRRTSHAQGILDFLLQLVAVAAHQRIEVLPFSKGTVFIPCHFGYGPAFLREGEGETVVFAAIRLRR